MVSLLFWGFPRIGVPRPTASSGSVASSITRFSKVKSLALFEEPVRVCTSMSYVVSFTSSWTHEVKEYVAGAGAAWWCFVTTVVHQCLSGRLYSPSVVCCAVAALGAFACLAVSTWGSSSVSSSSDIPLALVVSS